MNYRLKALIAEYNKTKSYYYSSNDSSMRQSARDRMDTLLREIGYSAIDASDTNEREQPTTTLQHEIVELRAAIERRDENIAKFREMRDFDNELMQFITKAFRECTTEYDRHEIAFTYLTKHLKNPHIENGWYRADNFIAMIKAIRIITGDGLKETKEYIEHFIKNNISAT